MTLLEHRQAAGITQRELADRTGVPQATISYLERARDPKPSHETAVRLARGLGVSTEELFPVAEHDDEAVPA